MKFQQGGAGFTAPTDNPVLLASEDHLNLNNLFFYQSSFLDMRAFQSWALKLDLTDGTMTSRDVTTAVIRFYMAPTAADSNFADSYVMYKTNISDSSTVYITDVCHGSWMTIEFFDTNSVNRTVDLTYKLWGSYRPVSNTFLRTKASKLIVYNARANLAAGAVSTPRPGVLAYGPAVLGLRSGAGGAATIDITFGEDIHFEQLKVGAANTVATKAIVLPREQMIATITNNGAGASIIDAYVVQSLQPF